MKGQVFEVLPEVFSRVLMVAGRFSFRENSVSSSVEVNVQVADCEKQETLDEKCTARMKCIKRNYFAGEFSRTGAALDGGLLDVKEFPFTARF